MNLRPVAAVFSAIFTVLAPLAVADTDLPEEPVEIGHESQFFIDDYIVDNRWPLRKRDEVFVRAVHRPVKHPTNPVLPDNGGYVNVVWDEDARLYRMLYQDFWYYSLEPLKYTYAVAYAESSDGIKWTTPNLGFYNWKKSNDNNICWQAPSDRDSPQTIGAYSQYLLTIPKEHRRGHKYVMYYVTAAGVHLVGSNDCIHWDESSVTLIGRDFHPDTHASIVWDPVRKLFVWFTRATDRYGDGENITRGATRRIARLENRELWTEWPLDTQNILIPDVEDAGGVSGGELEGANFFYGMPVRYHAGIYWGFVWPYRLEAGLIETQLAISRNGRVFERLPFRPTLIGLGPESAWDDGMVFGSPQWIEVGDQWRMYYSGHAGPHHSIERAAGIGVVTIRKEGFVSLRGPEHGGVVCTRRIRWPGGGLFVNCDATSLAGKQGELRVRVVDSGRNPLPGFGYENSVPFNGDSTAHEMKWKQHRINTLKERVVRLEFLLIMADLYTFRAVPVQE